MPQIIRRFLIPAYGADESALVKAFALVQALCERSSTQSILLVTPTRRQMDGTGLCNLLGDAVCKTLLRGESVRMWNGSKMSFATPLTFKSHFRHDIVLSFYGSAETLGKIEKSIAFKELVVVPWTQNDTDEWRRVWNPTIIEDNSPQGTQPQPSQAAKDTLSPTVVEGLKLLSALVNLSTGISHDLDKGKAVALFRALKKAREPFDGVAVKSWAVHNNWSARGAEQLASVAQAICDGKRVQATNAPQWGKEFVDKLRDRANGNDV